MAKVGYFVGVEKRQRDSIEFRRTHFSLGQHPPINSSQMGDTTRNRPGLFASREVSLFSRDFVDSLKADLL